MPYKGLFITIEGIDGSGKTTLMKRLSEALKDSNKKVLLTKEPGGSSVGKHLREILQQQPEKLDSKTEFLLFAADRSEHFSSIIIPALEEGTVVITDRCGDSSLAYQGYGYHVDKEMIQKINAWAMQKIEPNATFYLRVDAQTASTRIAQGRKVLTTFEKEDARFWERVINGYDTIFKERKSVCTIDASTSADTVFTQAWNHLSEYIL